MQAPKRLIVKLFVENPEVAEAEALIPIFQRWIQETAIENELLIDVADYKHVHHGPGIMLIAHEGDYAYQANGGQVGLSYTVKQHNEETLSDVLSLALDRVTQAARLLQKEQGLNGLRFSLDFVHVTLLDRLRYPHQSDTKSKLQGVLAQSLATSGQNATVLFLDSDPREALRVEIQFESALVAAM